MTDPTTAELVAGLRKCDAEMTQGEWEYQNPDDTDFMNIVCVTANGHEPEDEHDLGNVVAVTLLQKGGVVSTKDEKWDENAHGIAYLRNHARLIADRLERMEAALLQFSLADAADGKGPCWCKYSDGDFRTNTHSERCRNARAALNPENQ